MQTERGGLRPDAAAEINARVCCEDLAERLGLKRPTGRGNFSSPHHTDKVPSVSAYRDKNSGHSKFKDFSTGEGGGPIDMMIWARGMTFPDAVRELGQMYGISVEKPRSDAPAPRAERSLVDFIADGCLKDGRGAGRTVVLEYLLGRGIPQEVAEQSIAKGTLGMNTWNASKSPAKPDRPPLQRGDVGWGGDGVAFIIRCRHSGKVLGVDTRYLEPADNGGLKTSSQGQKENAPWCSDWRKVQAARTVYVVESAINALSIEACNLPGVAAVATRGTATVDGTDWTFLRGKQVIACFDNDLPQSTGYCAGLSAAWRLHEMLTALDISCLMVDQSDWFADASKLKDPISDVNDYLQQFGRDDTSKAIQRLEQWMIPGMSGDDKRLGKPRLFLPHHDYLIYWKFRVQPDFTKVVSKVVERDGGEGEDSVKTFEYSDVCGFRVAAVSRVRIASPQSTMTGDEDHSPRTVFALSVQVARHGPVLQRRVVDDERLHNIEVWKKLGPIYAPTPFARMVNVWERAASIGARDAINFVGLAWRDGKPVVNEGPDCFFADPRQQCPYHELIFPSGTEQDARAVVEHFRATFAENAALIPLVWGLGAHIKAFIGYWPHFVMQAEKATGKTTLVKRMERAIAMVMSSRQSLQTEFRQMTSLSYTSHPVGWGEMSTNKQDIINKAIHNLQESYQYEHTRRGAELMDFLLCAPVLLAGEDVPVDSLVGKIVRCELTKAKRGPLIPEDMPVFPVKQWLQFLARLSKAEVLALLQQTVNDFFDQCVAGANDTGAERMVNNYAAVGTAWLLLCRFTGLPEHHGNFLSDLMAEMNRHIGETVSDRQPWAWIVEKLFSEISAHKFLHPFRFDQEDGEDVLCIRTGHVMDHMRQTPYLREFWDGLPVKSDRVFKKQLEQAGVLATDQAGKPLTVERTVKGQRVAHMVALSLPALKQYGLHAVVPAERSDLS